MRRNLPGLKRRTVLLVKVPCALAATSFYSHYPVELGWYVVLFLGGIVYFTKLSAGLLKKECCWLLAVCCFVWLEVRWKWAAATAIQIVTRQRNFFILHPRGSRIEISWISALQISLHYLLALFEAPSTLARMPLVHSKKT